MHAGEQKKSCLTTSSYSGRLQYARTQKSELWAGMLFFFFEGHSISIDWNFVYQQILTFNPKSIPSIESDPTEEKKDTRMCIIMNILMIKRPRLCVGNVEGIKHHPKQVWLPRLFYIIRTKHFLIDA